MLHKKALTIIILTIALTLILTSCSKEPTIDPNEPLNCPDGSVSTVGEGCDIITCETLDDCSSFDCSVIDVKDIKCGDYKPICNKDISSKFGNHCSCVPDWCL